MSVLVYGGPPGVLDPAQGIVLSYLHTNTITDEPVYDDLSHTEYLYTRRVIHATCIFNSALAPSLPGEAIAATMARVGHTLSLPRRQLLFYHNSTADPPLFASPHSGFNTDAKLGPYPTRAPVITRIQGSECYTVDVEYETFTVDCPAGDAAPLYISHRWRESVAIDELLLTARTRQGKIIVRADLGISPDGLRGLIAPPVPFGYRRLRSSYVIQEDGLAMSYVFIDKEQYIQPPLPAVKAEGDYSETITQEGKRRGEVRVHLWGAKIDNIVDTLGAAPPAIIGGSAGLLQLALTIATAKLQSVGAQFVDIPGSGGQQTIIAYGAMRQNLYENEVEVRVNALLPPATVAFQGAAAEFSRYAAFPLGSDVFTQAPPDPGVAGTDGLGLDVGIANLVNDPCLGAALLGVDPGGAPSGYIPVGGGFPPSSIFFAVTAPDVPTGYRDEDSSSVTGAVAGVYGEYAIHQTIHHDDHTMLIPVALAGAPAAVVQVAEGTAKVTSEWSAEKHGDQPVIPSLYPQNPNITLLSGRVNTGKVEPTGDGITPKYRMEGRYEHAITDRSKFQVSAGAPPYVTDEFARGFVVINGQKVTDGILFVSPDGGNVLLTGQQQVAGAIAGAAGAL